MQQKDQPEHTDSTLPTALSLETSLPAYGADNAECTGISARIFEIQKYSIHDGPGIRTTAFFKGCPLGCLWCSNPESQRPATEVMLRAAKCIRCDNCFTACPRRAITLISGQISIDQDRCDGCLHCKDICPSRAIIAVGRVFTLESLLVEIVKDRLFYEHSGGGVTASGGEPLMQWQFLNRFFDACQHLGIGTALETSGCASREALEGALNYIDLVLFDVKHMDPKIHRKHTGQDNVAILENLRFAASRKRTWLRFPLIPGVNDSPENLQGIASLAAELKVEKLSILPYHSLGEVKYRQLGREYMMRGTPPPSPEEIAGVKAVLEKSGVPVSVSF